MTFYYHITTARRRSDVLFRAVMAAVVCFGAARRACTHSTLTLILWVDKSEQQLQQISSSVWYLSALIKMKNSLRALWSWGEKMLWDAGKYDTLNKNHAEDEVYRRTAAEGAINVPALIPVLITISEYIYISEYTVFSKFISTLRVLRRRHILFVVVMNGPVTRSHLPAGSGPVSHPKTRYAILKGDNDFITPLGRGKKARTQNQYVKQKLIYSLWKDDECLVDGDEGDEGGERVWAALQGLDEIVQRFQNVLFRATHEVSGWNHKNENSHR